MGLRATGQAGSACCVVAMGCFGSAGSGLGYETEQKLSSIEVGLYIHTQNCRGSGVADFV